MAFTSQDLEKIDQICQKYKEIKAELSKKIVGQVRTIDRCLIAILTGGHCLLVGVPGLAKTLIVRSMASLLNLSFRRIQFTPDLMPADITGAQIISLEGESRQKVFKFLPGPIFANVILADEINRTPPKTQAALIEAMEEKQVTVGGSKRRLDLPFFVMATQNPIEQQGTYPLPFAQLDRFMFQIELGYPTGEEEYRIIQLTTNAYRTELRPVLGKELILEAENLVRRVSISDELIRYVLRLVRWSRPQEEAAPDFIRKWVDCGAGPRGAYYLIIAAKAWAMLQGRLEVCAGDIRHVCPGILEHRLIRNYHAIVERVSASDLVGRLLEVVPSPDRGRRFYFWRRWRAWLGRWNGYVGR